MINALFRCLLAASTLTLLTPHAGAQTREIIIGQVAPFSGPQAVTGKAIHAGARLYLDQVNAEGGINGARLRLVTRDDAQKPTETLRLAQELLQQESPVALLGTVGTSNIQALIDDGLLSRANLALVGPTSGASGVIKGKNVFVVRASYHEEVNRLFQSLTSLQMNRVGLVYQDDGLGQDVSAGADAAASRHQIQIVARSGYERNTVKVEGAVKAMLAARPQAIFLGATTAAAIEFVRQYRQQGGDATLYGMSIIDTQQLLGKLGPDLARGFAFSAVLPLEGQTSFGIAREYQRLKAQHPDPDLSARSIEGYIAAKALVQALRTAQAGGNPGPAGVLRALQGTRKQDLGGYLLDFSQPGRSGSSYVDFAMFGSAGKIIH